MRSLSERGVVAYAELTDGLLHRDEVHAHDAAAAMGVQTQGASGGSSYLI
jgi:hypothetical protein